MLDTKKQSLVQKLMGLGQKRRMLIKSPLQNLEINGGDNSDDDDLVIEKPNRREALAALLTLQGCISDIGDPFARQLEAILVSFG